MNNRDYFNIIFANAWHKRTSNYGWRTYTDVDGGKTTDFHVGVDEASGKSNRLYPAEYGIVTKIGKDSSSGNYLYVWYAGAFHFFCHMASIGVRVGQVVSPSTMLGMSGNTGHSTGVHLHYGIRTSMLKSSWINPDKWIADHQPVKLTRYVNATRGLNVRTKPSILSTRITTLKNDTQVIVRLNYNGWAYVSYKVGTMTKYGWVSSEYLSKER